MRSKRKEPRLRKIRFSVTRREFAAAQLEAAQQRISIAELFRRRETGYLRQLEQRHASRIPPAAE